MATAPLKKAQISEYYMDLDQNDQILVEYVWIGGSGLDLRCKTKTIVGKEVNSIDDLPEWNFDGSSTGQAPGHDSEIILKPVALFKDPFRLGKNKLCLCACFKPDGTPAIASNWEECAKVMEKAKDKKPWFGIEQEYTLLAWPSLHPLGWPQGGFPAPQGPYYCSVGAPVNFGRPIVETHYRACLYAGVKMSGINAEVMPGQWEYQVGPCEGISMGNHLWISRYILHRVAEQFGVVVSLEPKPIIGDWNGAGCHTNVSTVAMREDGGMKVIEEAIAKLSKKHAEHIACYGEGNEKRLTGKHETASMEVFKSGVGDRGASIRIPVQCKKDGKGYFEDRRPASNIDPYVVTSRIVRTICLDE